MKRKLLKISVCLFGILFLTFPAWSVVPSNLLPNDGGWNQEPSVADVEDPLFEGDMVIAGSGGRARAGGKGGFSGSRTQSRKQERVRTRSQQRSQVQTKSQTQTQTQAKKKTQSQSQTQLETQSQSQVQAMPKKSTQDSGSGTTQ